MAQATSFPYKTAAITGASSGIGEALALELAGRGCHVGLLARRQDRLEQVAREVEKMGARAVIAPCDVSDRRQVREAIDRVRQELGPIDLLIANAGVGDPVKATKFDVDRVELLYRVNVLGAIYAIGAVLPEMLDRRFGHIVGISSLAGYRGFPYSSTYCATKAALRVQLEGLRVELRPFGIYVTTVSPGFIRTPMTAKNKFYMPFLMDADVAARKIANAIARKRRTFDFPWQMALFVRLLRLLPPFAYDRLIRPYKEW